MSYAAFIATGLAAAFTLQGCGGGGGGSNPSPSPPPIGPQPEPPKPMGDLRPIRGVSYNPLPCKTCDDELPARDMMQVGYAAQWGKDGRDDLGTIKKLGGNAVRLYHSLGLEAEKDHGAFLDRAKEIGIHVFPGFHTQNLCPSFNCFESWKAATSAGFKQGYLKDKDWHPAVSVVVLQEEPDYLNFEGAGADDCQAGDTAKCRMTAVLSALDGFLVAEKEAGIVNSTVKITVAWSSAARNSIDGKLQNEIGIYGFYDMKAVVADPSGLVNYDLKTPKDELAAVFKSRWINSMNAMSEWQFLKLKVMEKYKQFEPTPWFLSGWRPGDIAATDLTNNLQDMDSDAQTGGSYMGTVVYEFQLAYDVADKNDGLFALGKQTLGKTDDVCEEDVRTKDQQCKTWDVYCLDDTNKPASAVASAWDGKLDGFGQCAAKEEVVV